MIRVKTTEDGKTIAYTCEKMIVHERFIELKYKNENERVIIPTDRIIEIKEVGGLISVMIYILFIKCLTTRKMLS